jgi:hypothetical protein
VHWQALLPTRAQTQAVARLRDKEVVARHNPLLIGAHVC